MHLQHLGHNQQFWTPQELSNNYRNIDKKMKITGLYENIYMRVKAWHGFDDSKVDFSVAKLSRTPIPTVELFRYPVQKNSRHSFNPQSCIFLFLTAHPIQEPERILE